MNLKSKLAAAMVLAANVSMAQAATYNVSAAFTDGGVQGQTVFNGSFDWDGSTVSNFSGLLSESMFGWNGTAFDSNGSAAGGMNGAAYSTNVFAQPGGYALNEAPLLNLTNQLASSTSGSLVTVSTFLQNSTDVVTGGGYDVTATPMAYGTMGDGNSRNYNAFFTLVFDSTNVTDTSATADQIVYGDMTSLGLMGPMLTGAMGMTAFLGGGSMGGAPLSLSITEVAAVPLPGAVWLFGGALLSLFGANRRKSVLPA
ncbi:hypothetical protein [Methylomonas methanica]|uniref:Secreted protein n=1 Tax=Methylomonas methanica (strain DSM 25384 / MC09) TaxID=857087 RepID=G0A235_METMM|nr:hypothetical protein [Methylomonas methanica]AEG02578.1 protein of unknown function DUF1555 [Methylomonas methanica MC09]